jgi:hypothetical protein
MRARLLVECSAAEFAGACGEGRTALDLVVVDVAPEDDSDSLRPVTIVQRARSRADDHADDAGASVRVHLAPRLEVSDGR